ncbi:glutamate racemase [Vibrio sp. WJH972]
MADNVIANILVFDSGVGGLSVVKEIQKLLPNLNYTYLFDNQAYPYGELSVDVLLQRATTLIRNMVCEYDIDIVVVACNTASTVILTELRQELSIPVVGVVPAIKPACLAAKHSVGLLATPATIKREYTRELISAFSYKKEVQLLGSTQLVDMAEKKLRGMGVDREELNQVMQPFKGQVDVVVLGCTHFPLLRNEIQEVMGSDVLLVDSGEAIAQRVLFLLTEEKQTVERTKRCNEMFSSATPKDEVALVVHISEFGFNSITRYLSSDL